MAKRKDKKAAQSAPTDINALVPVVLRESYLEANEDLKAFADKIRRMNEMKRTIRKLLRELRGFRRTVITSAREIRLDLCGEGEEVRAKLAELIVKHAYPHDVDDTSYELCIPDRIPPADVQDLESLNDVIEQWEEELNTLGDDAQLANIDLQNILQKQQQTLQTMSNVSKILHDTVMAVIRKIG